MGAIYFIKCPQKCTLRYKKKKRIIPSGYSSGNVLYPGGRDKEFHFILVFGAQNARMKKITQSGRQPPMSQGRKLYKTSYKV